MMSPTDLLGEPWVWTCTELIVNNTIYEMLPLKRINYIITVTVIVIGIIKTRYVGYAGKRPGIFTFRSGYPSGNILMVFSKETHYFI